MTKPLIRIHNSQTNEIIDREMTDPEYAVYVKDQEEFVKLNKEKLDARAAKDALLEKLGISAEEAALLLL